MVCVKMPKHFGEVPSGHDIDQGADPESASEHTGFGGDISQPSELLPQAGSDAQHICPDGCQATLRVSRSKSETPRSDSKARIPAETVD